MPVGLGRYVRRHAPVLDLATHGVAVISLVAVQDRCRGHPFQQDVGGGAIGDVAAGQQKRQWPAVAIGQGVDFGSAAAA